MIDRRRFLATLAAGAATSAGAALAAARVPRVALISAGSRSIEALQAGLRAAGYVPGQTIVVEHRRTEGRPERYRPAVEAALKGGVDVIVVGSTHGLAAARTATRTVPIVAVDLETDPVASGFVESLARPGGNVTGFFLDLGDLSGKLLQLLQEAVPGVNRVAALHDPVIGLPQLQATRAAAGPAGITLLPAPVQKAGDLSAAIESAARDGARALVVLSAPLMRVNQTRIDELALRHRLPSVTLFALLPNGHGFLSYGQDLDEMYRGSGSYVDRILKGARAAELPVQRPSRFELAVNLRTAKALRLSIPPPLIVGADRVIE
ncbi:MAG: ABC transporter substrate-binding protein [Candidatus Rokuibacteriota bacterium]